MIKRLNDIYWIAVIKVKLACYYVSANADVRIRTYIIHHIGICKKQVNKYQKEKNTYIIETEREIQ
jgi:hypothetical protein